jgi:hypothetical protein
MRNRATASRAAASRDVVGELQLVQIGMRAVLLQQLLIRADFGDLAFDQHGDAVRAFDRRQAVRNDRRCPAVRQFIHAARTARSDSESRASLA